MNQERKDFFWPSYVDLMTALFLVMLVLFVLSYKQFQDKEDELVAKVAEKEKFDEIMTAIQGLQGQYFTYRPECKRHELKVNVVFDRRVATLPKANRDSLYLAGQFLLNTISKIPRRVDVKYLIVVEGRAAKDTYKSATDSANLDGPVVRQLSFERAMSLVNYWRERGLDFDEEHFEIIAAGSGFRGACRYSGDEEETKNRRFVIQIIPKIGSLDHPAAVPPAVASRSAAE